MTYNISTQTVGVAIAAAAILAVAAPAAAQITETPISVSVSYADLDLGHAVGARVLFERIKSASIRACGGAPDVRVLKQRLAFNQCVEAATSQAVAQVGAPILTSMAGREVQLARVARR
jgi:UrcA family protein